MGILSTIGTLLLGAAVVGTSVALQNGDTAKEKFENFNKKINKEVEKKSKK